MATDSLFMVTLVDSITTELSLDSPVLSFGGTYYWRVYASNENGESAPSEIRSFTTEDGTLETPVLTAPENNAVDVDTVITFSWQSTTDGEAYKFQLAIDPGFTEILVDSLTTELSLDSLVLSSGTTYYWRVRAENETAVSNWASRSFITITSLPLAPALLTPKNGSADADTALIFTWENGLRAETYTFQLSTQAGFTSTISDISTEITTVEVSGLEFARQYYWRVKSISAEGESDWSTIFSFTTQEKEIPPALAFVANSLGSIELAEDFESIVAANLDTVFTNPEGGALTYQIDGFNSNVFEAELNGSLLNLSSIENLFGAGQVVVKASNTNNDVILDTLFITIKPVNDVPVLSGIPEMVEIKDDEEIIVSLDTSITDVEDSIGELDFTFEVEPSEIIFSFDETDLSLTISAPDFEGEGSLTITVTDSEGLEATFVVTVVVEITTSNETVENIPQKFALRQNYPNPFNPSTEIQFDLPWASEVRIEVFSMLGQKVATISQAYYAAGTHKVSFDASRLSSGIYIYRFRAGDFVQTKAMTLMK